MAYNPYYPGGNYQPPQLYRGDPYQQQTPAQIQPAAQPQQGTQGGFVCRPVTSREEAVAAPVDFFGPGTIMPDLGHGMIYLKRFDPSTGSSNFIDFAAQPQAAPAASYDPRPDIERLSRECAAIREDFEEIKRGAPKRAAGKAAE